ncbi:MAG: hypothetical protein K8R59_14790 [Thermoanaerobaculales bacterium]|nr:hypothetical protein [Thermoanaerobaculales bacterium]
MENPGYYVRCSFQTGETQLLSAPSSSALLAWFAKHLTWGLSPGDGLMDLRQMGLLFMAILAAIFATGIARGFPIPIALLMVYVIVDPGYLLFFNSFYADGALFVALIGASIWLERLETKTHAICEHGLSAWILAVVAFAFLAFLGSGSKMQYVFFSAVMLLAMGIPLIARIRVCPHRIIALIATVALVFLASWWNFFFGPGPRFLVFNNYHAVYGGILRVVSEPEKVLEDLDVPRQYWNLPKTDAWSGNIGIDHPVHQHLKSISRLTLLKHYVFDSSARSAILKEMANKLALIESHPRGTRVREESGRKPVKRTLELPWQYSRLSRWFFAAWPPIIWFAIGGCAAWILIGSRINGWTGMMTTAFFLLLWIVTQAVIAVLGEGLINLHQHLIGARLGLDLLFVFVAADMGSSIWLIFKARRTMALQTDTP